MIRLLDIHIYSGIIIKLLLEDRIGIGRRRLEDWIGIGEGIGALDRYREKEIGGLDRYRRRDWSIG